MQREYFDSLKLLKLLYFGYDIYVSSWQLIAIDIISIDNKEKVNEKRLIALALSIADYSKKKNKRILKSNLMNRLRLFYAYHGPVLKQCNAIIYSFTEKKNKQKSKMVFIRK